MVGISGSWNQSTCSLAKTLNILDIYFLFEKMLLLGPHLWSHIFFCNQIFRAMKFFCLGSHGSSLQHGLVSMWQIHFNCLSRWKSQNLQSSTELTSGSRRSGFKTGFSGMRVSPMTIRYDWIRDDIYIMITSPWSFLIICFVENYYWSLYN